MLENRQKNEQGIISVFSLLDWAESFLVDRKAGGLSLNTVDFYGKKLRKFIQFCQLNQVQDIQDLDATSIRKYILWLEELHHNPGGIHAHYRVLRTFLYWYERENDLDGWSNPIKKVKVKLPKEEPLEPADINAVKAMMETCPKDFTGSRDRAMLLMLLDTGLRASELLDLNCAHVNPISGSLQIMKGKGGKYRMVYLGKKSRIALRAYLKYINDPSKALFLGIHGERLTYTGLRMVLRRRAKAAGVPYQSPHSFRRLFALEMLRNGTDVFSLQLLMGHADLQVLRRYLKQVSSDLQEVHHRASPVDQSRI